MTTGLELYEALKPTVGEDAARMIAEALPLSERVATKADLDALESRLVAVIDARIGAVDGRISATEARIYQRMLALNVTLFLGLAGMIVAILLK